MKGFSPWSRCSSQRLFSQYRRSRAVQGFHFQAQRPEFQFHSANVCYRLLSCICALFAMLSLFLAHQSSRKDLFLLSLPYSSKETELLSLINDERIIKYFCVWKNSGPHPAIWCMRAWRSGSPGLCCTPGCSLRDRKWRREFIYSPVFTVGEGAVKSKNTAD